MPVNGFVKIGVAVCAVIAASAPAHANSAGVEPGKQIARTGCSCHLSQIPSEETPLTQLFVVGAPQAYEPEQRYRLTLLVLGPVNPLFGGFALEVTGGKLRRIDGSAQAMLSSECDLMERDTQCDTTAGGTHNRCWIATQPPCSQWDGGTGKGGTCVRCAERQGTEPPAQCRECRSEVFAIEATHTSPKTVPVWEVEWEAPPAGSGPVTIYFAGNSVDGVLGFPDHYDHWNVLEPIEVPEAE